MEGEPERKIQAFSGGISSGVCVCVFIERGGW